MIVEGETQHNEWTKIKHVPQERIVAVNLYPDTTPSLYSSPSPSYVLLPNPTATVTVSAAS
jgi:hypothetical protein